LKGNECVLCLLKKEMNETTCRVQDLSQIHKPISDFIGVQPLTKDDWKKYKLTPQQVEQFHRDGFIKNIPVLTEKQCDILLKELERLMNPAHPGFSLWYEFHANETGDPKHVLFHSLGSYFNCIFFITFFCNCLHLLSTVLIVSVVFSLFVVE
jgi:hypothetical protein